jgi:hypothetical protein
MCASRMIFALRVIAPLSGHHSRIVAPPQKHSRYHAHPSLRLKSRMREPRSNRK